jgi:hypothetical protein
MDPYDVQLHTNSCFVFPYNFHPFNEKLRKLFVILKQKKCWRTNDAYHADELIRKL